MRVRVRQRVILRLVWRSAFCCPRLTSPHKYSLRLGSSERPVLTRSVRDRSATRPSTPAHGVRSRPLRPAAVTNISFPGCDSMTRGNGLPWLYSARRRVWPGAALPLCRLTSRGISSAARRARAKRGDPWPRPQRRWQACSRPLTIRTSVRATPGFQGCAQCRCPAQDARTCGAVNHS